MIMVPEREQKGYILCIYFSHPLIQYLPLLLVLRIIDRISNMHHSFDIHFFFICDNPIYLIHIDLWEILNFILCIWEDDNRKISLYYWRGDVD